MNNLVCCGDDADEANLTLFKNLVASVHQIDDHAPRLTVEETLQFSNSCKIPASSGVSHTKDLVGLVLEGLGLSHVKDTFVGNEQIRGVSGGQRRRVTLGEMLTFTTPLLIADEISTGLDTASTVDIMRILSFLSRVTNRIAVISLLQPSPEAVALFDEIILLGDGGDIIFAGPTSGASAHFNRLGFKQPDAMDDADFLLAVASADREYLYRPEGEGVIVSDEIPTSESLGVEFQKTEEHAKIMEQLESNWNHDWSAGSADKASEYFYKKYQNSLWASALLNFKRAITLWKRDKPTWVANQIIRNINVGLSTGFLFLQSTESRDFLGALFQVNMVSIMLCASSFVNTLLDERSIFYKHHNSNFYSSLSYVLGQVTALVPSMIIDASVLGSLLYWMVGFTPTAGAFFIYFFYFLAFNMFMLQLFNVYVALAPNKSLLTAACTFTIFFNTLFCGFIISPDVIPVYWIWIYWMMPSAWVYRGLVLNQLDGADLTRFGFVLNGVPFTKEWIGYGFAYVIGCFVLATIAAAFFLHLRVEEPQKSAPEIEEDKTEEEKEEIEDADNQALTAFTPVDLSFHDLCYEVKASKGSEKLRLLKSVSGIFRSGRMCALMGESGAGKVCITLVVRIGIVLLRLNFTWSDNIFFACS
jgi:ABC-type multidrug transport system ATPase subunit